MDNSRISVPEAISIVLIVLVAHTLVSLPKSLLNVTGSATIINLLYVGIILFFIVFFIFKLYKYFAGQDIIDISNFLGGPVFQKIVGMIFILYFVFHFCSIFPAKLILCFELYQVCCGFVRALSGLL